MTLDRRSEDGEIPADENAETAAAILLSRTAISQADGVFREHRKRNLPLSDARYVPSGHEFDESGLFRAEFSA